MKSITKVCLSTLLILSILFSFTACTGSSSTESAKNTEESDTVDSSAETKSSLDLRGSWVEKGQEGSESYQAGFIEDDVIEIYWMSDHGNTASLYWSGSFEAPADSFDEYTWDSVNDTVKTNYALLASDDNTKTFTYKNGELSYQVTALGITKSVSLEKTDRDYTQFRNSSGAIGAAQDGKNVELVSSRYWIIPGSYGNHLFYAVQIHNPNEKYAVLFPKIHITARASDGSILKTEDQTLSSIAAADTITYGNSVLYDGPVADTVELYVDNDDQYYTYQESSEAIRQADLVISNVSVNPGMIGSTFTGEVTNRSTVDADTVCIIVMYKKDGQFFGGETTYIDNLRSGESKPFEVTALADMDYDSYEIYALNW